MYWPNVDWVTAGFECHIWMWCQELFGRGKINPNRISRILSLLYILCVVPRVRNNWMYLVTILRWKMGHVILEVFFFFFCFEITRKCFVSVDYNNCQVVWLSLDVGVAAYETWNNGESIRSEFSQQAGYWYHLLIGRDASLYPVICTSSLHQLIRILVPHHVSSAEMLPQTVYSYANDPIIHTYWMGRLFGEDFLLEILNFPDLSTHNPLNQSYLVT